MDLLRNVEYNIIPNLPGDDRPFSFSFLTSDLSVGVLNSNPIFFQDHNGNLKWCNKSFESLVGKDRPQLVGRAPHELFEERVAAIFSRNFYEVLQSHKVNQFVSKFSSQLPGSRPFLVTMSYSDTPADDVVVVSSFTNISRTMHNLPDRNSESASQVSAGDVEVRQSSSSHLELAMYSEQMKAQVAGWFNRLQSYLNEDGKCILSSILKSFRSEFSDGIDFISERLFDEKHRALYEFLTGLCPRISKTEMRLCALLSLNYTLAEIAILTRKSPNSVNVAFARIRTKLGLTDNDKLKSLFKISNHNNSSGVSREEGSRYV